LGSACTGAFRLKLAPQAQESVSGMRVLIVDDHEVVRKGVRSLLLTRPDLDVCGEAVDGRDAVEKASQLKPDVIVMDVSMPRLNGLEATRLIRSSVPETEILILSQHDSPELVRQAFTAGARGYVCKSSIARHLLTAVNTVSRHESFVAEQNGEPKPAEPDLREVLQRGAVLEQALRESEERFRATFELAAVGVAHMDTEGRWIRVNQKICDILGYSADELLKLRFQDITHPDDLARELKEFEKVLAGSSNHYSLEKRYRGKNGSWIWATRTVSPAHDSSGKVKYLIAVSEDITERKQIEVALHESQDLLRAAFAQTYSFLALVTVDGTILEANRAALEGTGFGRSEVIGRKIWEPWWQSLPEEQQRIKASLETAAKGLSVREECPYSLRDGSIRFVDCTLNPVQNERGEVILVVASGLDITEQKRLRDTLEKHVRQRTNELEHKNTELEKQTDVVRDLSARLLQIQDDERRRIARELHDSVGQMLAAVSMNNSQLSNESSKLSPAAAKILLENGDLVRQISGEIRTISHLLHPPLLDEVGLESAIRWYIDGFRERSKIQVDLELPEDFGRLSRDQEITLFRVVQECLTNIHRHSGSSTALIRVSRSPNGVSLEVRDEGKGIAPEVQDTLSTGRIPGVGFRGMRERLHQLGGQLELHSTHQGTTVVARLPIAVAHKEPPPPQFRMSRP
jgi:PAS domain S-box-containing protein